MTDVITDFVSVYGEECWLIAANPIRTVADWKSVSQYETSEATEYFLFSAETEIVGVELLASFDANQPLWAPIQEDFIPSQIIYRGHTLKVWQHVSMFEEIPQEDDDIDCPWNSDRWNLEYPKDTLIRGFVMKRNMMWQFFVEQESPETTIQNFVVWRKRSISTQ